MKLVTGIEAIQSGKPWKHQVDEDWCDDGMRCSFIIGALRKKEFIIKEEPREFWIDIDTGKSIPTDHLSAADIRADNWIRVREVEK